MLEPDRATLGVAIMAASLALALRLEWLDASSALMSGFLLALSLSMLVASIALGRWQRSALARAAGPDLADRTAAQPSRIEPSIGLDATA